jgi:hypothetical protein
MLAVLGLAGPAAAQPLAPPGQPCVDVRIGSEAFYGCLNQALQDAVPQRRFSAEADAPFAATIPAPAAGTFNRAAVQERLGNNFGRSALPQRPPPALYAAPLFRAR